MNRWMGSTRLMLRTRKGRRTQDAGAVLRAVARGGEDAVGIKLRDRRVLLVLEPALVGQLLAGHAAETVKGPGVQLTRDLLGDGLLTSEGDDHRRARRLVAPAFSPRRLETYTDAFVATTTAHVQRWRDGEVLDLHHEMATLTLAMVGRTLLGIDLTAEAPEVRAGLEAALRQFGGDAGTLFGRDPVATADPSSAPAGASVATGLHALVDRIIAERRANPSTDRGDVVSALLVSHDDGGLTDAEVHDHVMTLLMAGHETTANALTWTWHLLAGAPAVQERLLTEASTLDGAPTFARLGELAYTRAVISEAMRLYPPAWIMGRTTTSELALAGWQLPAGTVVVASPLLLHHDARWWPQPEVFDPDRWLDERNHDVPRHAYLPFGTGPRACIGEQFAWAEAVSALAVMATRWSVSAVSTTPPTPEFRVTLRPAGGLPLRVLARG